jgi:hypothetical protein
MTPYLIALAFVAGFAGAWQTQEWRAGHHANQRAEKAREDRAFNEKANDTAAVKNEKAKVVIQERFRVITNEVHHVTQSEFYAAGAPACLDPAGVQQLRTAVAATAPASVPAPAVPAASRTHWWQPRRDPAMGS